MTISTGILLSPASCKKPRKGCNQEKHHRQGHMGISVKYCFSPLGAAAIGSDKHGTGMNGQAATAFTGFIHLAGQSIKL
jgi:hypothetical protein